MKVLFILVFIAMGAGCSSSTTAQRESISLSGDWRFSIDKDRLGEKNGWTSPKFDDTSWVTVTVPHTWNVMSDYSDYAGLAWYRKTFTIPEKTQDVHLRLHFDAVFYMAHVWLNG